MDVDGELHLHGVRFLVGEGLHADDGLALVEDLDAPVDARLAVGVDLDGAGSAWSMRLERLAVQFQDDLHALLRLQVVVDVGRQDHLVLLHEEPRGLQADDQVLAGDHVGLRLRRPWCRGPWPRP